jgi:hypothetical protein
LVGEGGRERERERFLLGVLLMAFVVTG